VFLFLNTVCLAAASMMKIDGDIACKVLGSTEDEKQQQQQLCRVQNTIYVDSLAAFSSTMTKTRIGVDYIKVIFVIMTTTTIIR